jgi:hypothetical protein
MPSTCSPIVTPSSGGTPEMVCADHRVSFPDAERFVCYEPADIEPCLQRCVK